MTDTTPARHPHAFASDNWAGIHPEIMDAIVAANVGHAEAYGGDPWTAEFEEVARTHFGPDACAFPVFNGTGANVLALQAALPRWGAVICAQTAHVNTDETGAPEKTGGMKLLAVATTDGKLTPELVDREAWGWGSKHRSQPLAVTISQSTELGTCYTPAEIQALADQAHEHDMLLHIDGSRLAGAATHLGTSLAAISSDVGADLVSLGGTKAGGLGAEAVIVLQPGATPGIEYLRKINLQLSSKMRFVSAQLTALYGGDLWQRSAAHGNAMAARLAAGIERAAVPGVRVAHEVQSNAVFVELPEETAARARERFAFGAWPTQPGLYRLMCAFDTTPDDVDELVALLTEPPARR